MSIDIVVIVFRMAIVTQEAVKNSSSTPVWMETVIRQVTGLRYGVIQLVIHDSRVVQIERTEKVRLTQSDSGHAPLVSE
jgi:hypothetical protein